MDSAVSKPLVWTCERERKTLHKRTNKRLTNTQFEAEAGRRASFRETLQVTLDCMAEEELVSKQEATDWAACPDETLALRLLTRALETAVGLQEQMVPAAETIDLADKTLKLMLEDAQAKDAWIKKKGLVYPGRELKKAA